MKNIRALIELFLLSGIITAMVYAVIRVRHLLPIAVLCFVPLVHADRFIGGKADSLFFRDSAYTIAVILDQSTCDSISPCILNFVDGAGPGSYFFGLRGKPGDTLKINYSFPANAFRLGNARIVFTGPDGRKKAEWPIRLGYRDPYPTGLLQRESRTATGETMKRKYFLNGRIKK